MRGKWRARGLYGLVLLVAVVLGIALGAAAAWATVDTTHNKVTYSGNGSTTSFPYDFKIFENSDLKVLLVDSGGTATTQELGTDYSVSGAGDAEGGSVEMTTAPASGTTLVILRELDIKQETAYPPNSPFPAASHEAALDRLTMIAQQNDEKIGRAVKLPEQMDADELVFPVPVAGRSIKWNASADELINSSRDPDAVADQAAAAQAAAEDAQDAAQAAQSGAESAKTAAESARDAAQAAAAGVNLPSITSADANKLLQVNSGGTGYVTTATTNAITGLRVARASTSTLTIYAGAKIPINGVVYSVDSDLTLYVATIAAEALLSTQWYWVCAGEPSSGRVLTATDFYAYRVTVNWYGGGYWIPGTSTGKRVLFPVRTDGSGNVIDFSLDGGYWMPIYPVQLRSLDTASPATSTTAVTMLVPSANGHRYQIDIVGTLISNGSEALLRFGNTGAAPTNLENAVLRSTSTGYVANTMRVVADTDRQISYIANSNATSVTLSVGGFMLPSGMAN